MAKVSKKDKEIIAKRIALIKSFRDTHVREAEMASLTEAEMHYTDAAAFANAHYGETYRETTRHDCEWD